MDIWGETDDHRTLIGEVKWTDSPCKKTVYFDLLKKAEMIKLNKNIMYILISKSGFVKELQALKTEKLILIDLTKYKI
jgi:hypothetical protein